MVNKWDNYPLRILRRQLEASPLFTEELRSHLLLWTDNIIAQVRDDPRHEAIGCSAVLAYSQCLNLSSKALENQKGKESANEVSLLYIRWSTHLAKSLRLMGVRATAKDKYSDGKKGDIFTPPRQAANAEHSSERAPVAEAGEADATAA